MPSAHPRSPAPVSVAALYRFARFEDCEPLRAALEALCAEQAIRGTLLLAPEGINGTIAGAPDSIARVLAHIRALPDCADLDVKLSTAAAMPFERMKVRVKPEIVTMGEPGIDPRAAAGTYVAPHDWNALIADPDTIVIDTRNDYEVAIGSFAGAIDPATRSFREFPEWFRGKREELLGTGRQPRVAMFCTGGIRCEKSTAFLKEEGVEEVYHLKGGILAYLEAVPEADSLWRGECYVFDQRVAIGHGLAPGSHDACLACGRPISAQDAASPHYEAEVSCAACHGERSEEQRATLRERRRQAALNAAAAARPRTRGTGSPVR
ncbi:rhodanese-related sulfurtransferase [Erythrobacter sp. QSSC1-22B]|uniref:oxygen-dependent tRNA uridine(34) hydroxylase TrhO n=1 Tax=Erythrobacter sp. QSSC1-22B TaxID=1860125 RepID=UPI001F265A8C|nr:rhodanese-related sulfurtransferase [Erythrobacter sp. QSSC1-22B]